MYSASRLAFTSSLRILTYSKRYVDPHFRTSNRLFSSTSSRPASESPLPTPDPELYARLNNTTLAKKLQQSPDAILALKEFIELLQKEGLDVSSGKPPSTMQIVKLGMKKEVRDGMTRMTEAMQKAGVDPTDKNMLAEVMAAMKKD